MQDETKAEPEKFAEPAAAAPVKPSVGVESEWTL